MKQKLQKFILLGIFFSLTFGSCNESNGYIEKIQQEQQEKERKEKEQEEKAKKEAEERKKQEEKAKQQEEERKKQEEKAKQQEEERKKQEEKDKQQEEERKKQEEKAKQQEEERKKQEEKDKQQEEERKKQEEKDKQQEEERKKQEEKDKQQEEERKKQEERDRIERERQEQERREQEERDRRERERQEQERREQEERERIERERQEQERREQEERERIEREERERQQTPESIFLKEFEQLENPQRKTWVTVKMTGQRCPACGPTIPSLLRQKEENKENLVVVFMHSISSLTGSLYTSIGERYWNHLKKEGYTLRGIPNNIFNSLGSYKENRGLYEVTKERAFIKRMAKVERKDRNLEVMFTAKAINGNEGTFRNKKLKLVVWVLESKINSYQYMGSYVDNNFEHNYVFRDNLTNLLGDEFKFNEVYKKTFTLPTKIADNKIADSELVFMITDSETGQIYDALEQQIK